MQDQIEAGRQHVDVMANDLAHAPLDAIAFVSFSQHLARGQANARPDGERNSDGFCCGGAHGREPGHGSGELLAGGLVDALVIGVLAKAAVLAESK